MVAYFLRSILSEETQTINVTDRRCPCAIFDRYGISQNKPVSQMQAPLAVCREPAGSYNRLPGVLYVLSIKRNIV